MTWQEVIDIVGNIPKIDIDKCEIQDQILFISAMSSLAEQIKPLMVKYVDKLPKNSTFLFKL